MFIFTKSLLCYAVDYVPLTGRRFTVSSKMKTNVTWIYSASHFASVEGAQDCRIYFRLQPRKWKTTTANSSQKGHLLFGLVFIDRVCSLRGMNMEESKVKVGVNYGKSSLKE